MATPAVGAGAAGAGGEGAALDYAATTDDQILEQVFDETLAGDGSDAAGAEADQTAEGGEGQGQSAAEEEGAERAEGAEEQETDENLPLGEVVEPANLKPFFEMKGGQAVRDLFYREQAYREAFPTVAEARKYRELYPTVEDLESGHEKAVTLDEFDDLYYSADPAKADTFLGKLAEEDARAFQVMAERFPDVCFQRAPEVYREIASRTVTQTLGNLMGLAQQRGLGEGQGGQNLKNAIDVIAHALFGSTFDRLDQRRGQPQQDPRLEQERTRFDQQRREFHTQRFNEWHDQTNTAAADKAWSHLEGAVKSVLAKGGHKASPEAIGKMTADVYKELDSLIRSDRNVATSLRRMLGQGKLDQAHRDQVVNFLVSRFKGPVTPKVVAKVVSEWTGKVLGQHSERLTRQRTAQQRKDITGGSGGAGAAGKKAAITSDQIDYSKTSDDDLLSGRATVKKK